MTIVKKQATPQIPSTWFRYVDQCELKHVWSVEVAESTSNMPNKAATFHEKNTAS